MVDVDKLDAEDGHVHELEHELAAHLEPRCDRL